MSDTATNPIADLPTGEPIPSSTPLPPSSSSTPSSKPPRKQPALPLRALLALTPKNVDAFLSHLNRCLSTPSGIDTVLLFLCYTSRFSSSLLSGLATRALHRSASEWVALVSASNRTTVLLATDSKQLPATAAAAAGLVLAKRLGNLSSLLSEARTILRLWGLLGMYFWAKRLLTQTFSSSKTTEKEGGQPKPTTLDTVINYSQLTICIVFQALENGAYLSSKGVMGWSPATQGWAMKWSARLWGLYVGVELGKLAAEKVGGGVKSRDVKGRAAWKSAFVRNMAWAPLTVHWGSDRGLVADWMVGALASVPGFIQMGELWAETA
ncbi:hypothetical protein GE09DRAFT_100423 [Coniochaeta sp. 2T2.1]|nr:hypothetical protein GE09DRAFT_100423 [Coniochaeta sp. 2T2.1]